MAKLIVVDGPDLGNEYEIERPDEDQPVSLLVGRDPRVAVALSDNAVSREHCRIEATRRGFRVLDLGSRNRTYLNGDPVDESWLKDEDSLTIGDTELRFEDDAPTVELTGMASTIVKEIGSVLSGERFALGPGRVEPGVGPPPRADSVRKLRNILELANKIAGSASTAELCDRFLQQLAQSLAADHGVLLIRHGKGWVSRAQVGGEDASSPVQADKTVIDRAAAERKAILSQGGGGVPRGTKAGENEEGYSVLAAPILRSTPSSKNRKEPDEVIGLVYLDRHWRTENGEEGAFDDEALQLLVAAVEPLAAALERLEEQDRLLVENRNLMRTISENRRIIGNSPAIRNVLDFIGRAAPTEMTVLVEGETGTGKELVASAVHYSSPRRGRPFVAINCAALPEHLVESELFGHERGAFTGAVARKKGRFELANTGTVFLDEVGELTLACQAKLLRLLEEKRFERVGGTQAIEVDVRILAATNKDILQAVARKEFREDLYYRLGVLNLKIPPLRERREDIPLLVEHFLAARAYPKKCSKAAEKKLMSYSWPGNVRQLRNVIESAVVLGDHPEIQAEDLALPPPPGGVTGETWRPISLQDLERQHVLRVLEHTRGNKKRAAEILGIERCTLYSKLKNYGT